MNKSPLQLADIQKLHQTGQLAEAKTAYLALLKNETTNVAALYGLAMLCAEEGDLESATIYLQQAIVILPSDPALKLNLANILKAQGELEKAVEILLALVDAHPQFAAAFNNLGSLYFAQKKWSAAMDAYHQALELRPDYADAYYNLGLAENKAGHIQKALNAYQALLELDPEHAGANFHMACIFMRQNKYQDAVTYFLRIEKKHAFHFETQANLAVCYLKLGQLSEAKKYYLRAAEIMPSDAQVIFNLAVISMQEGRTQEAIQFYLQVLHIDSDYYDAHNNLGYIFLTIQNRDSALLHFREALRLQPENKSIRHTVDILTQNKHLSASPPEYIQALFDSYADHFDHHLKKALHYQLPELMQQMLKTYQEKNGAWDILDLGCGTGLCGVLFKSCAKTLVGIDLSERMLAVARDKHVYDQLVREDIVAYLARTKETYDLVLAADVLVYFGDLTTILPLIAESLKANGLFIFNAEIGDQENYKITASGRFVHRKIYLDELILQNHFSILEYRLAPLRTQNQQKVLGHVYLLQKTDHGSRSGAH